MSGDGGLRCIIHFGDAHRGRFRKRRRSNRYSKTNPVDLWKGDFNGSQEAVIKVNIKVNLKVNIEIHIEVNVEAEDKAEEEVASKESSIPQFKD